MSNIDSVLLSIPKTPFGGHFLAIDRTEAALYPGSRHRTEDAAPNECCRAIQEKCNAWLFASSRSQDTIQVSEGELDYQKISEILLQVHERLLCPNGQFLLMPRSFKPLVHNVTYWIYMSACLAEISEPLGTNACDSFKAKEYMTLDMLESNLHILDLKKQCAEAEVDLFYEAIERTSELGCTDDGTSSSGTAATYELHTPANSYAEIVLDDLFSNPSKLSMAL